MVTWRVIVVLASLGLPAAAWAADAAPQGSKLQDYRVKAALPSACAQLGGNMAYGIDSRHCELPKLTSQTPSKATTVARPLPVTTRH